MAKCAKEGTYFGRIMELAIPLCQAAERECPRVGPGRKPEIPDWVMAVLIVIAVLKRRKSKSSQYRYLQAHQEEVTQWTGVTRFPSRSTYFDRYRRAWKLFEVTIRLAGVQAIVKRFAQARCVAADKSVIPALGPKWNKRQRTRGRRPSGVDPEANWTFSKHQGWTYGYSYEVVVTAGKTGPVWPLLASAGPANWQPARTFPSKISQLPKATRYLLADSGYDGNDLADLVEYDSGDRPTGRRLICPYPKGRQGTKARHRHRESRRRKERRCRRRERYEFSRRPWTQKLMHRRGVSVEPFNDWLKTRFDLHHRVWHRGRDNNCTQILAATFAYQLLLFLNHACGHRNAQIQWIIDTL